MVGSKFRVESQKKNKKTVNRAGGESFEIKNPTTKLISIVGGSFFAEPRYYENNISLSNKTHELIERLNISQNKTNNIPNINIKNCNELDDVSREVISTAWDILNGENPKDLLCIANWLRSEMNIRLTPQVFLVLASRHPNTQSFVREYAQKIIQRPDEIKTVILLHRFFFGKKNMKNCLSRGLSDAMSKVSEKALIKYEGKHWPSWKDVLNTIYRKKDFPVSKELYEYFCYGKVDKEKTPIAFYRKKLFAEEKFGNKARKYAKKSFTNWEVLLSKFGNNSDVWSFLIEEDLVGYMALLRNIRNILDGDVDSTIVEGVVKKLSDREEVLNSRQLPFRFVAAAKAIEETRGLNSRKFLESIEDAIDISIENISQINGSTIIFSDNSGSMGCPLSEKSTMTCLDAANILAAIFSKRSENARVFAFATDICEVNFTKNTHALELSRKLSKADTKGCATYAHKCIKFLIDENIKVDRVIILSDMQCYTECDHGQSSLNILWKKYKKQNESCWLHSVDLSGYGDSSVDDKNKVSIVGSFSEKIIDVVLKAEGNNINKKEQKSVVIDYIRENF